MIKHANMFNYQTLIGGKSSVFNFLLILISVATITLSSCQKFNDISERLDKVESELNELKALQDAFNQAKVISSYSPITDAGTEGWSITFTDGTIIRIISEHLINSISEDEKTHVVTMVLADGRTFSFNTQFIIPSSIVLLNTKPIVLSTGEQASIEFRVNPSTAVFDYSEENCQIELDKAGTVQTKASYVTKPQNYKLVKIEQVVDEETQEVLTGQYRAVIEDTGRSAEYDEMVALVLNTKDAKGNDIQISSSVFEVIGKNFDNLPKTGLPVVVINTVNAEPIVSKDDWKEGAMMSIINTDMTFDYQGTLSIKGRGNTTWGYPKKSYALKLDSKSKVLGMPKHKRWCLLANWMDRTMIRNAVAFEIARKSPGLEWTPRGEFVEVILNGTHIGNYYLCEQIKVDKNRVDIEELDNTVTEGDGITGGFIMELDTYYDEVNKFKSARRNLPWMFKDPDEVNSAQFTYMQNYVNAMEDALYDDAKFAAREFTNYMDLESFVDWWFVYELAMNSEPYWPKSSYMHKDKNDVIKAGPVWDFDWGSFVPGSTSYFCVNNAIYYGRLLEDAGFKSLVKTKWQEQKSKYEEIGQFIDALGAKLSESDELNHIMWPISSTVNGDESMNYDEAVSRLKAAYLAKLNWMDTQISSW